MLSCKQEPKSLSAEQPVFSLAMNELVVCHTAISKEERVYNNDVCVSVLTIIFVTGALIQPSYTDGG